MDFDKITNNLKTSLENLENSLDEINKHTQDLTLIPAPPFQEEKRALEVQQQFQDIGYLTKIDKIGNVFAYKSDTIKNPILIAAHLDTVFGEEVEIKTHIKGKRLYGPGVGDDTRGLTNLIFIAKELFKLKYKNSLIFVANVGEEGVGDLRGTKYIFDSEEHQSLHPIKSFVTIDGTGSGNLVTKSIGSLRYRVHFNGPGGHSFGKFGIVNPVLTLGDFLSRMQNMEVPKNPKTTFSAGIIHGGISVNTIPANVYAEIDLRSESPIELKKMNEKVKQYSEDALKQTKSIFKGEITANFELIGERPAGELDKSSPLLSIFEKCNEFFGLPVNQVSSSTDANIPQNRGIPAVCVSGSHLSGHAHSVDEWVDISNDSLIPIKRNLLFIYSLATLL